jgi:omega-amidase
MRFPLLSALMSQAGCRLLFFPGAFNTTTGPAHWELLQRARALDTQSYVCTVSPARSEDTKAYQAWGHSTVVSPWGEVVATTDDHPGTVYADLHLPFVDQVRRQIPVLSQARTDLYTLAWVGKAE